ncbi:hypothetical protein MIR68_007583 [Amoeboaphelidium protococcarum]|nr:hypothetical protein MIR68_007583 [Amoeboaphelidium protococcarum]
MSAAGILSMLQEQELVSYSVQLLLSVVDFNWMEISEQLTTLEGLQEQLDRAQVTDKKAGGKGGDLQNLCLLLSKLYFHLTEYNLAVDYALKYVNAGGQLNVNARNGSSDAQVLSNSLYNDFVVQKSIELYIAGQKKFEQVVNMVFKNCIANKEWKECIGIALECNRMDVVAQCVSGLLSSKAPGAAGGEVQYLLQLCGTLNSEKKRSEFVSLLVKQVDFDTLAQCWLVLNDSQSLVKAICDKVASKSVDDQLLGYQVAFDIYAIAPKPFVGAAIAQLKQLTGQSDIAKKLISIFSGELSVSMNLEFMFRNNHTDLLLLKKVKNQLDSRNSANHSAVSFAHALCSFGTTSDTFLRDNMEWLARASNWTKYSACASLGVVHFGNRRNSLQILSPYLPKEGGSVSSSVFSEGGAYYALGLIHVGDQSQVEVVDTLKAGMRHANPVVQNGACLGMGACALATKDEQLGEALKNILYGDAAVSGEAASLAIGMVNAGAHNDALCEELLQYARVNKHDKIIRALTVGIGMIQFGRGSAADKLIESMLADNEACIRNGGVHCLMSAYCATGSNVALKKLLHIAATDVSDDVRRVSVIALGFVLARQPKQLLRVVELISDSYNPDVRYGVALAIGITCAGSGSAEAMDMLNVLVKDSVDYVRQGALIAIGMVMIEQNESNPRFAAAKKHIDDVLFAKHENLLARFGATLAVGIMNAGGRNVSLSLLSSGGIAGTHGGASFNDSSVSIQKFVGLSMFIQFWWWFPLTLGLSLALEPTAFIGIDQTLKIVNFEKDVVMCNTVPSQFQYAEPLKEESKEKVEKVAAAVLSTTAKSNARAKHKAADKQKQQNDTSDDMVIVSPASDREEQSKADGMNVEESVTSGDKPAVGVDAEKKKAAEEKQFMIANLTRVTPNQAAHIQFVSGSRFQPVKKSKTFGVVLLKNVKPDEPVEYIEYSTPTMSTTADGSVPSGVEPEPPAPFEYTE